MEPAQQHFTKIVFDSPTDRVRVVGTQAYRDAVWRAIGPPAADAREPAGRASWRGEALLEPECDNPHDCNAVRVTVGGQTVGYLPRELAARVQPALLALERRGTRAAVAAYARGGFEWRSGESAGERASAGLMLRLDPAELLAAAEEAGPLDRAA